MSNVSIRSAGRLSRRSRHQGFTLVEILIVVIILGILAAIVIPQFTNASTQARASNMASQCQTIKSQIELYKLQHNDTPPTQAQDLFTMLLATSDANGNVPPATGASPQGPYLPTTPVNPLTNSTSVDYVSASPTVSTVSTPGTSVGTTYGWVYLAGTGEFHGVDQGGYVSDDGN